MKDYGRIHGSIEPLAIEITPTAVFIATDVEPYSQTIDDKTISGYEYHYVEYTKDEYLLQQSADIAALQEELAAAKILLGVD